MKLNIIKYYYIKNKLLFNKKNNFIFKNYIIIKLSFYEYIDNKLKIFNFKGILIYKNLKNNNIIILKYNNNDILFLYFYLNIFNLINIFKIGKLHLKQIKYLL